MCVCAFGNTYVFCIGAVFSSSWDRKCYLSNMRKTQEVQTACFEFQRFLTPVMEWEPEPKRARERERERTMSNTQFHQKDTNVQTGGLESHRWLDTHKRSIMKLWKEKTIIADMGQYAHISRNSCSRNVIPVSQQQWAQSTNTSTCAYCSDRNLKTSNPGQSKAIHWDLEQINIY